MARADLLLTLVRASLAGDQGLIRSVVSAMAAEERAKRHTVLASDLARALEQSSPPSRNGSQSIAVRSSGYLEIVPERTLDELLVPDIVRAELDVLVEEQHRAELLRAHNLEPRHKILLVGPPGNGKTTCAEALASSLSVPLLVLRYEEIITSFLGETSSRMRAVIDDVRNRHCVLFLDEFETLAKERGDEHDAGEMKRIVSTLLLQLDDLPSHVVVCAATNHAELLDRAVWRRFQVRLDLPSPTRALRTRFLEDLEKRLRMSLGRSPRHIADKLKGASYAELEEFAMEVRRRQILSFDMESGSAQIADLVLKAWLGRATPSAAVIDFGE